EWGARVNNGSAAAAVVTLASSPVTGELIQNNGANLIAGSANAQVTKYTAAGGGLVFATGSSQWDLGLTSLPDVEPITANVLAEMSVQPTTPDSSITLDGTLGGTPPTV